jgi:hypothetical protein
MADFYTILTSTGRAKLANAQVTGVPVSLTHMAVGDGENGAYYLPSEAQTTLKHEVWRGAINSLYVDPQNPNWIVAELVIPDTVGGFYIREVGLFDAAGALIAVGKFPESYKPTLPSGSNKQLYVRMILEVSNTSTVTLLVDPSVVLATRQYVDQKVTDEINKLDGKQSVRVATTGAIALNGLQTIDGVVLVGGDRVLVKDQAAALENGIYIAAAGAWARAADADAAIEVTPGLFVAVEQGTANADSLWQLVTDAPITLGTTALAWEMVSGKAGITAGTYRQVTVDQRGRVTGGTNPTTLAGYGITDGVNKGGDAMSGPLDMTGAGNDPIRLKSTTHATVDFNAYRLGLQALSSNDTQGANKPASGISFQGMSIGGDYGALQIVKQYNAPAGVSKGNLFHRAYNGGAASWEPWRSIAPPPRGAFKNLDIHSNWVAPNTKIDVSLDDIVLSDVNGLLLAVTGFAGTIDMTANGAGGLDTGARAASTWYHLFIISNGVNVAGLASLSSTAPTLPAGYTFAALVGIARTDASGNLLQFHQRGDLWQYKTQQIALSGSSATAVTALNISSLVPVTIARSVMLMLAKNSGGMGEWLGSVHAGPSAGAATLTVLAYSGGSPQGGRSNGELMLEWPEYSPIIYYSQTGGTLGIYINGFRLIVGGN